MIKEEYKDLPDTEFVPLKEGIDPVFWGKYKINKLGEIISISTNTHKKFVDNGLDYPWVTLYSEKNQTIRFVHTLVAKTFISPEEGKPVVDHIDRNIKNYSVYNLRYLSQKENNFNRNKSTRKTLYYYSFDDNKNKVGVYLVSEFSRKEQLKISESIRKNTKYKGLLWKRIDIEVESFLKKLKLSENDLVFKEWPRDKNLLVCKEGIIKRKNTGILFLGTVDNKGYRYVGSKYKSHVKVHRIVFETFSNIELNDTDYIDHINTDRQDNRFINLRKSNPKDNSNNVITIEKKSKPVVQFDLQGNIIKEYPSVKQAGIELGKGRDQITSCCTGHRNSYGGYKWMYKKDYLKQQNEINNSIKE